MKLIDLNPKFYDGYRGEDQPMQIGCCLECDCPCGCADRLAVPFKTSFDGKPWQDNGWERTGDTFETLTLRPSIQRLNTCRWHGFITNGEVTS